MDPRPISRPVPLASVSRLASAPRIRTNQLGRYRLVAELAQGGMGIVYLAVVSGPSGFNKLLVIKELKSGLAAEPESLEMFLDEARLAAKLSHPNIVQTLEVNHDDQGSYLVMEYLEGQPLHRSISRITRSKFPLEHYVKVLTEVLDALQYAHELTDFDGRRLDVVHRDVSPQNVILTYDGQVKLVDFGIAKAIGATHETRAGMMKGKLGYMAPEQARGKGVDLRADIYSVGVMLWEAIARKRMWDMTAPDVAILTSILAGERPNLRQIAPGAPDALVRIAERALAIDPNQRYASAASMRADLVAYLRDSRQEPTSRDLGNLVRSAFTEERAKMHALIEGRIHQADEDLSGPQQSLVRLAVGDGTTHETSGLGASSSGSVSITAAEVRSHRMMGIIGAVAALLSLGAVVAVVLMMRSMKHDAAPAAAPAQPTAVELLTQTPAAATPTVQLSVTGSPANAILTVDGARVPGNPYSATYPRDGAHHKLRVEAPGFVTKNAELVADRDISVNIALERIEWGHGRRPAPAATSAPAAAATSAPAPAPASAEHAITQHPSAQPAPSEPAAPAKPKRLLSGEDPYQ